MRFVKLSKAELVTLQEGHKFGSQFQFRNRCQCLVFSHQGNTVSELAQFFEVNPITIYGWFDRSREGRRHWFDEPTRQRQKTNSFAAKSDSHRISQNGD